MTNRKLVKRHLDRAGNSIPGAAQRLGVGEGTLRRAVDRGEIAVVRFGGLTRITNAEIERVRALLGLAERTGNDSTNSTIS
jgi:excisionase family DNA binding protein